LKARDVTFLENTKATITFVKENLSKKKFVLLVDSENDTHTEDSVYKGENVEED